MNRLTAFSKIILFLTSYIPLGIICLIIDFDTSSFLFFRYLVLDIGLILLILLLVILLILLGRHFRKRASDWEGMTVVSAENKNSQIITYVFSYILPFLSFPSTRRVIIGLLMLVIIGILYIKSDMIGINPMLTVFGYNIVKIKWYKIDPKKVEKATMISKLPVYQILPSNIVEVFPLKNGIYLLKEPDHDRYTRDKKTDSE
jgi:hypothetical protein